MHRICTSLDDSKLWEQMRGGDLVSRNLGALPPLNQQSGIGDSMVDPESHRVRAGQELQLCEMGSERIRATVSKEEARTLLTSYYWICQRILFDRLLIFVITV